MFYSSVHEVPNVCSATPSAKHTTEDRWPCEDKHCKRAAAQEERDGLLFQRRQQRVATRNSRRTGRDGELCRPRPQQQAPLQWSILYQMFNIEYWGELCERQTRSVYKIFIDWNCVKASRFDSFWYLFAFTWMVSHCHFTILQSPWYHNNMWLTVWMWANSGESTKETRWRERFNRAFCPLASHQMLYAGRISSKQHRIESKLNIIGLNQDNPCSFHPQLGNAVFPSLLCFPGLGSLYLVFNPDMFDCSTVISHRLDQTE